MSHSWIIFMTYTDRQIRTFERLFCTLASNLEF